MAKPGRFQELQDHSLRLSDVTPVKTRANIFQRRLLEERRPGKLPICDFSLGDPTQFGFMPPTRLRAALADAVTSNPSYTHSIGLPELLEELRYYDHRIIGSEVRTNRLNEKDVFVFTGPGSSGVVRAYMGAVAGGKKHKSIVFVPELTYPLFLAESAYVEADIVTIPLDPKTGVVDPDQLKSIMEKTIQEHGRGVRYVLVGTTIGNPLGSAMDQDTFDSITRMLTTLNKKFNIRLHRITDPTYEPFRRDQSTRFDPVQRIMEVGSTAIELVTGTFSKSQCWCGKRIGYGYLLADSHGFQKEAVRQADAFNEMLFRHVDVSYAITLGTVDVHTQMAAMNWLRQQRTDISAFTDEQKRQETMRSTVGSNTLYFAEQLLQIPMVKVHPFCLDANGLVDPNKLNSFYIMWRFRYDRNGKSQAARFAEWTLNQAMQDIVANRSAVASVVFMSDGDMFFARDYRNGVPQYIRTVALRDEAEAGPTLKLIRDFAAVVQRTGAPPEYVEVQYPF
ncbi:MAG: aminotransferase class I/II-fold pyridoxal phosphate-dependent enzyme [Candidatus Micrarchaeota archaeon]